GEEVIEYWLSDIALPASLPPEVRAQMDADVALSRRDVATAVAPLSHCYLDVPYAEPSADPRQAARQGQVGQRLYSPKTAAESFDWEPTEAFAPSLFDATAMPSCRVPSPLTRATNRRLPLL